MLWIDAILGEIGIDPLQHIVGGVMGGYLLIRAHNRPPVGTTRYSGANGSIIVSGTAIGNCSGTAPGRTERVLLLRNSNEAFG